MIIGSLKARDWENEDGIDHGILTELTQRLQPIIDGLRQLDISFSGFDKKEEIKPNGK